MRKKNQLSPHLHPSFPFISLACPKKYVLLMLIGIEAEVFSEEKIEIINTRYAFGKEVKCF